MSWGVATRNGVSIGVGSVVSLTSLAASGGPTPPSYAYFMSVVTSAGGTVTSNSLSIDSSDQATMFGGYNGSNAGLELQLGSTGLTTLSKQISPSGGYSFYGVKDSVGNYYAFGMGTGCLGTYLAVYKYNSALSVTASTEYSTINYPIAAPVIDSIGTIWCLLYESYNGNVIRIDSSLSVQNFYIGANGSDYYSLGSIATNSAGKIIITGQALFGCCCFDAYFISSMPTSNLGTVDWGYYWNNLGNIQFPRVVAVDASNNVYVACDNNTSSAIILLKFNSAGTLQWQRELTAGAFAANIVFDSIGNVYVIVNGFFTPKVTIIKLNSSGTIQYANALTAIGANIAPTDAKIKDDKLYIAGNLNNITTDGFLIKLPIDGSLTQSISVGGYSLNYAVASVSATVSTYSLTASTAYNFTSAVAPSLSAPQTTISDITTTSSRANL